MPDASPLRGEFPALSFRPLRAADLDMLHDWLCRPHVAQWLAQRPVGFFQSYVVMGSGAGWWPDETDSGARGIDQFLAHADQLGRGLGSALVNAFVDQLFADPAVTQVQTDPSPDNARAIRCYRRAGFVARAEVVTPDGPALLMLRTRGAIPRSC